MNEDEKAIRIRPHTWDDCPCCRAYEVRSRTSGKLRAYSKKVVREELENLGAPTGRREESK